MIEWRHPLFLLLLIPWALLLWQQRRSKARAAIPWSSIAGLGRGRSARLVLSFLPGVFHALGVAILIVAMARPQRVNTEQVVSSEGIDIVLAIDVSGSMGWSFQGSTFMDIAKEHATNQIQAIPVNSDYMLQVYSFGWTSTPVFQNGPMLVTGAVKQKAIDFVSGLNANGGTFPFAGLTDGIQKEHVEQMIILSDGVAYDKGQCFHNNRYYTFAECFADYNTKIRTRHVSIPAYKKVEVKVDTISLKYDFCSGNGIPNWRFWVPVYINGRFAYWRLEPINKKWLGDLARLNNGQCTHVK